MTDFASPKFFSRSIICTAENPAICADTGPDFGDLSLVSGSFAASEKTNNSVCGASGLFRSAATVWRRCPGLLYANSATGADVIYTEKNQSSSFDISASPPAGSGGENPAGISVQAWIKTEDVDAYLLTGLMPLKSIWKKPFSLSRSQPL